MAPGRVTTAPGFVKGFEDTEHVFLHDATAFRGSSGSALLSLGPARVSGLHFAGEFGTANFAHLVPALASQWGV